MRALSLKCLTLIILMIITGVSEMSANETKPLVLIINYPYQIWASDATKIHLVLFKPDFTPAVGAEVKAGKDIIGKADVNGVCIFDYNPGSDKSHVLTATLKESGTTYEVTKTFSSNSRTASFESEHVYVYTDRGVYNPGQKILSRLIAWRLKGEYSPLAGEKIQLLFQDKSEKVYSGMYVTTNEFGVGSTEIPLPENIDEGDYQLVVLYKKARETASIRITRFVPPVIKIEHNLKRYLTDVQKDLAIDVTLSYFSGGMIKSSSLVISIIDEKNTELFNKKVQEKSPGVYSFALDKQELDSFRGKLPNEKEFKIRLNATDSYGRSDKVDFDVVYTGRPYRAVIELDKDSYVAGEDVQLLAKVVDLDGKPAANIPLTIEVSAFSIKDSANTDDKGVATFKFKMGTTSATAVLKSPVMKSPLSERVIPVEAPKPMISKVAEPPKGMGSAASIKAIFDSNYIPIEKVVHVDCTDISGALVVATTIPVKKDGPRYYAQGNVISPTWGTMLCNLYCCAVEKNVMDKDRDLSVKNVGFITEGQHITFHPDKTVDIVFDGLKPRVSPGEKTGVTVKITKTKGEACIGASVVDAAVISLLDPFLKTPEQHFYNPQCKVISTGGAGVLTWPVVDRNWGSPWRDIAYSDWGWKAPGDFVLETDHHTHAKGEPMYSKAVASGGAPPEKNKLAKEQDKFEGEMPPSPPSSVPQPMQEQAKSSPQSLGTHARKLNGGDRESPQKVIIIRKNFPETCLWEPMIITKDKAAHISFTVPDAITNQQITIIASDKEGGIGFIRKDIEVRQEIFVRSGLPATMTLGDKICVGALLRNFSESQITCKVSLESGDFEVVSEKSLTVTVPKDETAVCEWTVKAVRCGHNRFKVIADSEKFSDSETRTIFVRPCGEPIVKILHGTVNKESAWTSTIMLDEKVSYRTVFLNVSFPNVFPALQGLEAMARYPHGCVEQTASGALTNVAVLEYGRRTGMSQARLSILEESLRYSAIRLCAMQYKNGAWGWFYLRDVDADNQKKSVAWEPNLYLTAYALAVLAEIKDADIHVSEQTVVSAMNYILGARNSDGLWSSKRAFFWDTVNQDTDKALSAELFHVLIKAASTLPSNISENFENNLSDLKERMVKYLKERPEEPLAIANAVSGLMIWASKKGDKSVQKLLKDSVDYLITLKRKGYWEPHWYHAYGGMVELNARILDLLSKMDRDRYEGFIREGVTWLLSTREAWGAWHNTMGTASAVRALLKVGTFDKEIPSRVGIRVNGQLVKEIAIDPADPYLSAASLRFFELTEFMRSGENKIEVSYNGNLKASAILETNQWGLDNVKSTASIDIRRLSPASIDLNEPFSVSLELTASKTVPYLVIEERVPANAEVDVRSLGELKEKGEISDYKIEGDTLYLYLAKLEGSQRITYKLTAIRRGMAKHAGTILSAMYEPSLSCSTVGSEINVK